MSLSSGKANTLPPYDTEEEESQQAFDQVQKKFGPDLSPPKLVGHRFNDVFCCLDV